MLEQAGQIAPLAGTEFERRFPGVQLFPKTNYRINGGTLRGSGVCNQRNAENTDRNTYASAARMKSRHFCTSSGTVPLPGYSYSTSAGIGCFLSFSNNKTCLMGVSP